MELKTHVKNINSMTTSKILYDYIKKLDTDTIKNIKLYMDDIYYNTGKSETEDWKYDTIKETICSRDPTYKPETGCKLRDNIQSIKLPVYMGSLDKIKKDDINSLRLWLNRNGGSRNEGKGNKENIIITDKLDGISCLLKSESGNVNLYTRGDGTKGSDITFLLDYINYIPDILNVDIMIRGEIVVSTKNFKYYSRVYKNSRNMVSGIVNAKSTKQGIEMLDFVAYEIIGNSTETQDNITSQLESLNNLGFRTVKYSILNINSFSEASNDEKILRKIDTYLSKKLIERKGKCIYDIDGLVIYTDNTYIRNVERNPKYAISYKENEINTTTVIDVEWNVSRTGMLKPRVKVEPIILSGAKVSYATGFNGKFIKDNDIGPGSVINITRSGEVIPHIVSVVKSTQAKLPEVEYTVDINGIEFMTSEEGDDMKIKKIVYFFKVIEVKCVSIGIIKKLYDSGYKTILSIIKASPEDLQKLEGFKKTLSEKICNNIKDSLMCIPIHKLMVASGEFPKGIGEHKMLALCNEFENIHEEYINIEKEVLIESIISVKGFSTKTAELIIEGLPKFKEFYDTVKKYIKLKEINKNIFGNNVAENIGNKPENSLRNMNVIFTGFRNKDYEEFIILSGGSIANSMSKKVNLVVYKDGETGTTKIKKAIQLGIKTISRSDFEKRYIQ